MGYSEHERKLLKEWVVNQEATRMGKRTTIVCLTMSNGYEVLGTSACTDAENYQYEEGIYFATKAALQKLDEIVGYLAQQSRAFF